MISTAFSNYCQLVLASVGSFPVRSKLYGLSTLFSVTYFFCFNSKFLICTFDNLLLFLCSFLLFLMHLYRFCLLCFKILFFWVPTNCIYFSTKRLYILLGIQVISLMFSSKLGVATDDFWGLCWSKDCTNLNIRKASLLNFLSWFQFRGFWLTWGLSLVTIVNFFLQKSIFNLSEEE